MSGDVVALEAFPEDTPTRGRPGGIKSPAKVVPMGLEFSPPPAEPATVDVIVDPAVKGGGKTVDATGGNAGSPSKSAGATAFMVRTRLHWARDSSFAGLPTLLGLHGASP
jgi:hypothetical protein